MRGILLLDLVLAGIRSAGDPDAKTAMVDRLERVAASLISSANQNFESTLALSKCCSPSHSLPYSKEFAVVLRAMYEEDVSYAEHLLARIDKLKIPAEIEAEAERLRDHWGRAKAMLSVSLEDIEEGLAQIRRGQVHGSTEIRNELQRQLLESRQRVARAVGH